MDSTSKIKIYDDIEKQLGGILKNNQNLISAMSTLNSVLKNSLDYFYWVGFYQSSGEILQIGPYQGTLGCLEIGFGKGVCGTSFLQNQILIVPDTHKFEGHIACDSRSNSEIVLPYQNSKGEACGVLDVDSTDFDSFCDIDKRYLEKFLKLHITPLL